jgi:hypothetical protein
LPYGLLPKKIFSKNDIFLAPEFDHRIHHDSPANHHNITTKYHAKNAHFSNTPFKNAPKTLEIPTIARQKFFAQSQTKNLNK